MSVLLATGVRAQLSGIMDAQAPLLIYVLPVASSAYTGGMRPGLFATALGAVLGTYFFIEPRLGFGPMAAGDLVLLFVFLITGAVVSWLVERTHRSEQFAYDAVEHGIQTLGIVSHELRNPLTAIHAALAASGAAGGALDARARAIIHRQTEYLSHLVNDLIDAIRIERGGIVMAAAPVVLGEVIDRAVELAHPAITEREQQLRLDLPPEHVVVSGDAVRLRQVLSNLLLNASKYTPRGGHIHLSLTARDGVAIVQVRDSGVGLAPKDAAQVFEPYFSVSQDRRGLGLGLFIAKHLVERHGGRIEVASDGPGRGTTFAIQLPTQSAA
jgi:signal transduction histidine kinase